MKNSWFSIKAAADTAEISIHDEIGFYGVSAKRFLNELKSHEGIKNISLSVHSPGGSVLDGWAIYNAIAEHPAHVTAKVEGLAASMASVILMAADKVTMPENSYIMIHNPIAGVLGGADEMEDMAGTLRKIQKNIVSTYSKRTGLSSEEVADLMDHETYMDGAEAVERGFADEMTEPVKAAACAPEWRDRLPQNNLPNGLVFTAKAEPKRTQPEPTKPTQTQTSITSDTMSEPTPSPEPKAAPQPSIRDLLAQDKPRREEIAAIGKKFNRPQDEIKSAIENGVEIEAYQKDVLKNFDPESFAPQIDADQLRNAAHVGDSEAENYSLFKALNEHITDGRLSGLEKEVQNHLSENYRAATGKVADGLLVPAEFWNKRPDIQNAATVGTGTSGGNTVETEMQGLTDYLKDYSILPRIGATIFRDAVGNLEFPRSTAGYTGTWDAETDTIANADATFAANLTLSPKRVGAGTAVSKQLLAQSSVDFESWVRGELQYAIATAVDRAAITGGGGDAPTGVLSASGTGSYTWLVGSALWVNIVDQVKALRANKANLRNAAWLTDHTVRADWKKTPVVSGASNMAIERSFKEDMSLVDDLPFYEHTDVTTGKVVLADWSSLFVAMWGGIQLTYDPYSQKKSGQVELYAETFADCGLRQPNAFIIGDAGTTHAGSIS